MRSLAANWPYQAVGASRLGVNVDFKFNQAASESFRCCSALGRSEKMKRISAMLRTGPVLVGEVRGAKAETAKRFDKSDKNAAPIEFAMFKINIELLADGSPAMVSVFLDQGVKADDFAGKAQVKRGDIIAIAANKLELKNGIRRATCAANGFVVLEKSEAEQL